MPTRPSESRTVYTTESGRICPNCQKPVADCICKKKSAPTSSDGIVRVGRESKGRGGKIVSLVTGLSMDEESLKKLAADLKRRCGTGGTIKDGVIEIQGDHRDVLVAELKARGYTVKKVG